MCALNIYQPTLTSVASGSKSGESCQTEVLNVSGISVAAANNYNNSYVVACCQLHGASLTKEIVACFRKVRFCTLPEDQEEPMKMKTR